MAKSVNFDRLLKLGASRANVVRRKRATISIEGEDKSGKSHFLLTAPGPIAMIDMNQRADEPLLKFQDTKEIIRLSPVIDRDAIIDAKRAKVKSGDKGPTLIPPALHKKIEEEWERVEKFLQGAEESGIRSMLIDTGDELWELFRMARLGKLDKVPPIAYTPVNMEFERFLKGPGLAGKDKKDGEGMNLIVSHTVKDDYKNDKKTGNRIRAGFSRMAYVADLSLSLRFDEKKEEFKAKVRRCGFNPFWTGHEFGWSEDFEKSEVDFRYIMACVTREEDEDEDFDDIKTIAWAIEEEWD